MCVCSHFSAVCVSWRHSPRSLGTWQFLDRSPKFGFVDRQSFTDLKVPIWNRQNHIFSLSIRHNPCHSSNIFISRHKKVQPFSVFRSFRSRNFESQPSTSYRRTTKLACKARGPTGNVMLQWTLAIFPVFFPEHTRAHCVYRFIVQVRGRLIIVCGAPLWTSSELYMEDQVACRNRARIDRETKIFVWLSLKLCEGEIVYNREW